MRAIAGAGTVNGGDDADTINIGSNAAGVIGNAGANAGGNVDSIAALLTVNGDGGADTINIDDTGDSDANSGTLASTYGCWPRHGRQHRLRRDRDAEIGLGSGCSRSLIGSTHTGATNVSGNNGADIFNIRSIRGTTAINGGANSDTFNVGSNAPAANGLLDDNLRFRSTINGNDGRQAAATGCTSTTPSTPRTTSVRLRRRPSPGSVWRSASPTAPSSTSSISLGSGADTFAINDHAWRGDEPVPGRHDFQRWRGRGYRQHQ